MHTDPPHDPLAREAAAARLELGITELLRHQPLQRAPATLAVRVMAALEQRQRSAFRRWPLAVRIAFVVLTGLAALLTIELVRLMGAGIPAPRAPLAAVLIEAALAAARHLPSLWTYGALGISTLVYGGIFGIATAMYRLTLSPTVKPRL